MNSTHNTPHVLQPTEILASVNVLSTILGRFNQHG
jgi:hypothetical protein